MKHSQQIEQRRNFQQRHLRHPLSFQFQNLELAQPLEKSGRGYQKFDFDW
jgi:hypothetical protein